MAAALFGGEGLGLGLQDFTDSLARDPRRRALMDRISVTSDPICDEIFPNQFPAILRVRTRDGTQREERVLTTRGGPQRPLSDADLHAKLVDTTRGELEPAECDELLSVAKDLPEADDLTRLLSASWSGRGTH